MQQVTRFLLVPDSGAARRLRRELVTNGACLGHVVGVWSELIEYAKNAYLVAAQGDDWNGVFHACLEEMADVFWADSYQVAPHETASAIQHALSQVVTALEPGYTLILPDQKKLPGCLYVHLEDMMQLETHI